VGGVDGALRWNADVLLAAGLKTQLPLQLAVATGEAAFGSHHGLDPRLRSGCEAVSTSQCHVWPLHTLHRSLFSELRDFRNCMANIFGGADSGELLSTGWLAMRSASSRSSMLERYPAAACATSSAEHLPTKAVSMRPLLLLRGRRAGRPSERAFIVAALKQE
jgi:hypothetical protein